MPKTTVNLIIKKEKESPTIKKLNIILPSIAAVGLTIFILVFAASIIYFNNNIFQYNLTKKEIDNLEKKISSQKAAEGIYTLVATRLGILDKLSYKNPNFQNLISEVNKLNIEGVNLVSASSDDKGGLALSFTASSSASMDNLVELLKASEGKKLYSQIEAHGIVREKKGNYLLTITAKAQDSVLR